MTGSVDSVAKRVSTGVAGLDEILEGGLPGGRMYLLEGPPGAGKTTLAMQFLRQGLSENEQCLYVTLSETSEELKQISASHGWSLDNLPLCDLQGSQGNLEAAQQYTVFHPSEVELSDTTKVFLDAAEEHQPTRIVVDSLSEMRLLAGDSLRHRRQILALKRHFADRGATLLLIDTLDRSDSYQITSIASGVIQLQSLAPEYGGDRRRLRIRKIRGAAYREGYHDYVIRKGGVRVFPRLVASDQADSSDRTKASSGLEELDAMVDGGLEHGTSVLLLGPSGVGKSTVATQYVQQAAEEGRNSLVCLFDESRGSWLARARGLGMDLEPHLDAGRIRLVQLSPAEQGPGEFAQMVRQAVDEGGVELVVLDSVNGYRMAMSEEQCLNLHLQELLSYMSAKGVLSLVVMTQHGVVGASLVSPHELSYIADTVLLFRYFEAGGRIRQALSILKKRLGPHERYIRELEIGGSPAVRLGDELSAFSGVLSGHLAFHGDESSLLSSHAR